MTIDKVLYINLACRPDRRIHCESQLATMGWQTPIRIDAISYTHPILGCFLSHLLALEYAMTHRFSRVLICEDDVLFSAPETTKQQIAHFFETCQDNWDVLLLGGNNYHPFSVVDDNILRIHNCQCAHAYMVQGHYIPRLYNHLKEGYQYLVETGQHHYYMNDMYWKHLQQVDRWYLLTPVLVYQQPGYSNLGGEYTDNIHLFQKYDKKEQDK